jgi:hypothetical protein
MLESQKGTSAEAEVKNEEEAGKRKGRSFTECCDVVCCVLCCCLLWAVGGCAVSVSLCAALLL